MIMPKAILLLDRSCLLLACQGHVSHLYGSHPRGPSLRSSLFALEKEEEIAEFRYVLARLYIYLKDSVSLPDKVRDIRL